MHIYKYIYINVCININVCICMYIFIYMYVYVCTHQQRTEVASTRPLVSSLQPISLSLSLYSTMYIVHVPTGMYIVPCTSYEYKVATMYIQWYGRIYNLYRYVPVYLYVYIYMRVRCVRACVVCLDILFFAFRIHLSLSLITHS